MTRRSLHRRWRGALADIRGGAALEFALLLPILVTLYAVGFEVCQAATVKRKLTDTTVQLANLTSQFTKVSRSDISTIMNASSQTMTPFPNSALSIVVSEVSMDAANHPSVTWSESYQSGVPFHGTALTTPPTAPASFQTASSSYIVVQTSYAYTPVLAGDLIAPITLSSQSFMLPRDSGSIPCTDC